MTSWKPVDLEAAIRSALTEDISELRSGGGDWGPWHLDTDTLVLYPDAPYRYEVDLEDCTTSAQVLDWICQIAGKTWADDATLAGLVRAINDTLHPQANLCSMGQSTTMTRKAIAKRIATAAQRHTEPF